MTWDIATSSDLSLALPAGVAGQAPPLPGGSVAGLAAPGDFASVLAGAAPAVPPAELTPGDVRQALAAPGNFLPPLVGAGDSLPLDDAAPDDSGDDAGDDPAAWDSDGADPGELLAWWPGAVPPEPAPPPPPASAIAAALSSGGQTDVALSGIGTAVVSDAGANSHAGPIPGDVPTDDVATDVSALVQALKTGPDGAPVVIPRAGIDGGAQPLPTPRSGTDDAAAGAIVADAGANATGAAGASAAAVKGAQPGIVDGNVAPAVVVPGAPAALTKDVKPVFKATLVVDDKGVAAAQSKSANRAADLIPGDDKSAGPAGQVFAARIGAGLDAVASRSGKRAGSAASIDPLNLMGALQSGGSTPLTARPVMGAAAADLPVIQASDPEWIEKFVDQIDMMRGDNGTSETRIRLSPDALGTLDVRIAQRDGQTQVQINADQAGARALLADAAPRLADLAQARGLKLNTSFADGQGQPSQRQDQGGQSQRTARNADTGGAIDADINDERIG